MECSTAWQLYKPQQLARSQCGCRTQGKESVAPNARPCCATRAGENHDQEARVYCYEPLVRMGSSKPPEAALCNPLISKEYVTFNQCRPMLTNEFTHCVPQAGRSDRETHRGAKCAGHPAAGTRTSVSCPAAGPASPWAAAAAASSAALAGRLDPGNTTERWQRQGIDSDYVNSLPEAEPSMQVMASCIKPASRAPFSAEGPAHGCSAI